MLDGPEDLGLGGRPVGVAAVDSGHVDRPVADRGRDPPVGFLRLSGEAPDRVAGAEEGASLAKLARGVPLAAANAPARLLYSAWGV